MMHHSDNVVFTPHPLCEKYPWYPYTPNTCLSQPPTLTYLHRNRPLHPQTALTNSNPSFHAFKTLLRVRIAQIEVTAVGSVWSHHQPCSRRLYIRLVATVCLHLLKGPCDPLQLFLCQCSHVCFTVFVSNQKVFVVSLTPEVDLFF